MITRKSLLGSRNLYRFVTQTSHDRMDPTVASYRLYNDLAAVIAVSKDLRSPESSHAGRAQGKIMKPRSCVVLSSALGWRVSVHHLQANLSSQTYFVPPGLVYSGNKLGGKDFAPKKIS
ncbi:unsaturated glucuronyl hydrolase [Colletotrichum scovillei]|uniref:Unsaturated glucuronyl hydrolase n=1 Tax=Colletotrichum scovillei TaxID=1209932 RepID=A0A9P7UM75_9PEZI|nr:unsaturated glucuronyl hydrolase [Colletotrichum scovillei]KAG7076887.1 unsaturated glucuronyl hydrolase [Colletotrichum scovillei]KAG7084031.1 unsaturated glucuronyl hydrolase [Colletotrichum scovillei]